MRKRILAIFAFVLLLFPSSKGSIRATDQPAEPDKFFREYIGLSDGQIASIRSGKAIAKIIDSPTQTKSSSSGPFTLIPPRKVTSNLLQILTSSASCPVISPFANSAIRLRCPISRASPSMTTTSRN